MQPYQKHYHDIVQRDLILSENLSTVSLLSAPKKISLCLGGDITEDSSVIASLAALQIISGQKPHFTKQQWTKANIMGPRNGVGCKVTLRGPSMYFFFCKLLFEVLPNMRQFNGLRAPAHARVYSFILKDVFFFQELVPLFPYFEGLGSLQCQFHFTTKTKEEVVVLGHGLQLCFI